MEVLFVIIIIFALVAIGIKTNNNIAKKPKREYVYAKKACAMTQHELIFYKTLLEAISGCVIIPQAHLSMFLLRTELEQGIFKNQRQISRFSYLHQ